MTATILIVDDSPTVRSVLRRELTAARHTVLEAGNGEQALVVLSTRRPDLVISDQNMAPMDGLTLVARIREQWSREVLPVLMLTTERDEGVKARGRAAGATGWLCKPVDGTRLRAVVDHVLSRAGSIPPVAVPVTGAMAAPEGSRG